MGEEGCGLSSEPHKVSPTTPRRHHFPPTVHAVHATAVSFGTERSEANFTILRPPPPPHPTPRVVLARTHRLSSSTRCGWAVVEAGLRGA